jgi:LysR family glycine cleavage system transcriptional activator
MRKLPPLRALRAFEAAARHENVTRAAAELRVTHGAVSQQVRSLEDYFGQQLFSRVGRRIEPTDAAKVLLGEVSAAFDRIAIAAQQLEKRKGRNVITVNATPSFAMRWLIPRSSDFQIQNSNVSVVVETSTSDGIDHLTKSYDFIFRRAPMERVDHICRHLLEDASTPLMAPRLAEVAPCASAEDIRRGVLLHLKSRPNAWQRWFELCGLSTDEAPAGPYYEHFFLSLQAAINGLGIAIGPLCFVEEDLAMGRLMAPMKEVVLRGPGFHVLHPANAMRNAPHRAFLDALIVAAKSSSLP